MFYINNDLDRLNFDYHNIGHIIISFLLALMISLFCRRYNGFAVAYAIGLLWEIGDGFKPWYYDAPGRIKKAKIFTMDWLKREMLYSNKFSLQDIFIWNLLGAMWGEAVNCIIRILF